ncbi:hypothetical protein MMC10_002828 [Thelotrema lepadinum]|nr:hypothetical protein [Thelotrema lepadinum]
MDDNPRLYLGNLPYVAQQDEVEKLFSDSNIAVRNVDMSTDPFTGRNPSYCFVDFHNNEDATRAMETMQGLLVRDRPIKLNLKTEKRSGPRGSDRLPTKTYDRGWKPKQIPSKDVGPDAYVFDRWSRKDARTHWTAPIEEGRRVWVGGLPQIPNQDSVNAEMRELFSGWNVQAVSKIISPSESMRRKPGSHYYCFVDFVSPEEARGAVGAVNGNTPPLVCRYKVDIARPSESTKVHREQLGSREIKGEKQEKLDRNWRVPG